MTVNVDKMRRYSQTAQEAADAAAAARERRNWLAAAARERRNWLAAMTPEHRAKHEAGLGPIGICGDCLNKSLEPLRKISARPEARRAARQA